LDRRAGQNAQADRRGPAQAGKEGGAAMNSLWMSVASWLLHSALGGGLLLLLTWSFVCRTRQPARQQRLGEWGLAAAVLLTVLSLGPAWLVIPWKFHPESADPIPEAALAGPPANEGRPAPEEELASIPLLLPVLPEPGPGTPADLPPAAAEEPAPPAADP